MEFERMQVSHRPYWGQNGGRSPVRLLLSSGKTSAECWRGDLIGHVKIFQVAQVEWEMGREFFFNPSVDGSASSRAAKYQQVLNGVFPQALWWSDRLTDTWRGVVEIPNGKENAWSQQLPVFVNYPIGWAYPLPLCGHQSGWNECRRYCWWSNWRVVASCGAKSWCIEMSKMLDGSDINRDDKTEAGHEALQQNISFYCYWLTA